jgi:hypothetical protein
MVVDDRDPNRLHQMPSVNEHAGGLDNHLARSHTDLTTVRDRIA